MIWQLNYNDSASTTVNTLSPIDARKAILLRWSYLYKQEEARLDGSTLAMDDIATLTADDFDTFVQRYLVQRLDHLYYFP